MKNIDLRDWQLAVHRAADDNLKQAQLVSMLRVCFHLEIFVQHSFAVFSTQNHMKTTAGLYLDYSEAWIMLV